MEFIVLNSKLEQIQILDLYESLIWTDRYGIAGDFEIYTAVDDRTLSYLEGDEQLYIWSSVSEHLMMVETYEIESKSEDGSKIIVTGRSLEAVLERRIVWNHIKLSSSLQDGIEKLLNENAINPTNKDRKIPGLRFKKSQDPKVLDKKHSGEYSGDNLYDVICHICEDNDLGFKILLTKDDGFEFELYAGVDHSYNQTDNPFVIFSTDFQNLGSSNYKKSVVDYCNVIAVPDEYSGEGEKFNEYNPKKYSGMDRREFAASDRAKMSPSPTKEEKERLESIGKKELKEHKREELFEGQIESSKIFVYGTDFKIGDIVQIRNEYGIESVSRVTELVINQDQDTYEMYPTFEAIEDEEDTK